MAAMRVLYINHTLTPSGAAVSLGGLIRHLPGEVKPWLILRTGSEVREMLGVPVERTFLERWMPHFQTTVYGKAYGPLLWGWHGLKLPVGFLGFQRAARQSGATLVHLNETCLLPYAWFGAALGLPVVVHARTVIRSSGIIHRLLATIAHPGRLRVLTVDQETLNSLPAALRPLAELAPNPIDLGSPADEEARQKLRSEWGFGREDLVIGQVGSLHESKGVWPFVEMALAVHRERSRTRFVLVGDDRPEAGLGLRLKERIRELGLEKVFCFAGYRSDLAAVYAALDVVTVLFGAGLKGIGRSAFEAGIAGRPVVATCPETRSPMLFGGEAGRMVVPDDQDGLVREVVRLVDSPVECRRLGARARELLGPRHDPVQYARRVLGIYRELVASSAACSRGTQRDAVTR